MIEFRSINRFLGEKTAIPQIREFILAEKKDSLDVRRPVGIGLTLRTNITKLQMCKIFKTGV